MSKTKELEKLFETWEVKKVGNEAEFKPKGKLGQFVRDGLVCEKKYEETEIKVLFILKDPHDETPEIFYPRGICDEVMISDNSGSTWNRIAEWSRALTMGVCDFVGANELKKENPIAEDEKDGLRKYFKKIAIMNLKKASGKEKVSREEVEPFVVNDLCEIKEEISIISPDVIVACGRDVFELLHEKVFEDEKYPLKAETVFSNNMKSYNRFLEIGAYIKKEKPVFIIEYCHPTNFGRGSCSAKEHYQNMLKIRNLILDK